MQVYLPEQLYAEVKARRLPASELLQEAVRAELRRLDLLEATDHYLEEHEAAAGPPSAADRERADIVARRVGRSRPVR
jgi:post-segregation antitoxin (ccd killing protein)